MRLFAYLRSVVAKFFHQSEIASDMDEELASHIQHRADDLAYAGLELQRTSETPSRSSAQKKPGG